jgi:predicted DNA-binding ribbon-helix-helix protein
MNQAVGNIGVNVAAPDMLKVDEDQAINPGEMRKRSVVIAGHRTSVSLENAFWNALKTIATNRGLTVNEMVTEIDSRRSGNLSSAIRLFVLDSYRRRDRRRTT